MSEGLTRLSPALADRYRIVREVGSGAMAVVYLAHDLKHDREVALKVLRPELAAILGAERFLNEIRITARLDHPHILTLIDSGSADGLLYYVLPFVRGESLRDLLRREKQLSVEDAVAITRQVGSALEYAHRQGVIHRDIKPENILLHEGEAMLADFGIALAVRQAGGNRLTQTGRSLGTPQYMSPEQATGDRTLDARSDVYSLAAVVYEMLAGEPPHSGPTVQAVIAKLMTERPIRLRVLRDTVPEGIDTAVAKALGRVPADRYANAGEFVRALSIPTTPQPVTVVKWRWIAATVIAAVAAATAAVSYSVRRGDSPFPPPDRIQLTATGTAVHPSTSPDGSRLAFGEKVCDSDGSCTHRLVIQDVDGRGRLVVTDSIAALGGTEWTRDGKHLLYLGSYGGPLWGTFAISTLGGTYRYLGCCRAIAMSGDTAMVLRGLTPNDTVAWIIVASVRGGQSLDSIPVRRPGLRFNVIPTSSTDRLLVLVRSPNRRPSELRLIDRKGEVIDRSTTGLDFGDREVVPRWMAERGELLLAVRNEREGNEYDFLRVRATDLRIDRRVDTVLQRLVVGDGSYHVSPDGKRLSYSVGPVETSVWASERQSLSSGFATPRLLFTSTSVAFARISPAGDRVLVGRPVVSDGSPRFQLFTSSFDAWEESLIGPPLEGVVGVQWELEGNRILYSNRIGTRARVMEIDTTGRQGREIASGVAIRGDGVFSLHGGGIALIGADQSSISLMRRRGHPNATRRAPSWLGPMAYLAASPDGTLLGILGWDSAIDSAVVAHLNLNSGVFTRLAAVAAENVGSLSWIDDGSLVFDVHEARGAQALYAVRPGTGAIRLGAYSQAPATSTVSADGRRMVITRPSDKTDVYLIRNFGEFLDR
ncbi:MAG: protein kinase [Gemmatimonadota bacterium]|nr:protein kinase [Gemmatimonadota bacterium]